MGRACGAYGGGYRGARVLVGKPEGKRTLGRPRRRWEDNINLLGPELLFLILAHTVYKM